MTTLGYHVMRSDNAWIDFVIEVLHRRAGIFLVAFNHHCLSGSKQICCRENTIDSDRAIVVSCCGWSRAYFSNLYIGKTIIYSWSLCRRQSTNVKATDSDELAGEGRMLSESSNKECKRKSLCWKLVAQTICRAAFGMSEHFASFVAVQGSRGSQSVGTRQGGRLVEFGHSDVWHADWPGECASIEKSTQALSLQQHSFDRKSILLCYSHELRNTSFWLVLCLVNIWHIFSCQQSFPAVFWVISCHKWNLFVFENRTWMQFSSSIRAPDDFAEVHGLQWQISNNVAQPP